MNPIEPPAFVKEDPLSICLFPSTETAYLRKIQEIVQKALNSPDPTERTLCANILACHRKMADPRIQEAFLNYLFQYSQYNAPYIETEALRLGFSLPFYGVQEHPGYVRTQNPTFFELIAPWIETVLVSDLSRHFHCERKNLEDHFLLVDSSASDVLNSFANSTEIIEFNSDVLLKIYFDYYEKMIEECKEFVKELQKIKRQINNPHVRLPKLYKLCFSDLISERVKGCVEFEKRELTFSLNFPTFGFAIIWKGKIEENDKILWSLSSLDREKALTSLTGGTADRFNIHSFVSHYLTQRQLTINNVPNVNVLHDRDEFLRRVSCFEDDADPGVSLFKKQITYLLSNWNNEAFPSFFDFVQPFLSQIIEEPSATHSKHPIVPLVGMAQHCHELILLYFLSHSDVRQKYRLSETVTAQLSLPPSCRAEIKLLSYGMSSFFEILHTLSSGEKKTLCCLTQDYFEILSLCEKLSQHFECEKSTSLLYVNKVPDILVVDIHPNNAAQEHLHENDVLNWVKKHLVDETPNKNVTLILDVTLNHFSDPIIHQLLQLCIPLIEAKKLNLYFIQSLAKLIQLGLDNLSGGLLIHIQPSDSNHTGLARDVSAKEAFFSYLLSDCKDATKEYFQIVRNNTRFLYKTLSKQFNEISGQVGFQAMSITTNVDTGAVYIVLRFTNYLERVMPGATSKEKEKAVNKIRTLIHEMACAEGLPITSRQSLGFPLSNLCGAVESIRFSIGIENQKILREYVSLFTHLNYALSYLIQIKSQIPTHMKIHEIIKKSYSVLRGREKAVFSSIPLHDAIDWNELDEYYNKPIPISQLASVTFQKSEIIVFKGDTEEEYLASTLQPGSMTTEEYPDREDSLPYFSRLRMYLDLHVSQPKFFVESLGESRFYITSAPYCTVSTPIEGIDESTPSLEGFTFFPDFTLCYQEKQFREDQVYFVDPQYGSKPVPLVLVNEKKQREKVYDQWIKHHVQISPYEDGVLIETGKERKTFDYRDKVRSFFKKQGGGMKELIAFLNSLDVNDLPLLQNPSLWNMDSKQALINELYSLGYGLMEKMHEKNTVDTYRPRLLNALSLIREPIFREAFSDSLYTYVYDDSYDIGLENL